MRVNSDIITKAKQKLKLREYPNNKEWVEKFNSLVDSKQEYIIEYFDRMQSLYIRDSMEDCVNPIYLLNLGIFYYKQARKDFYDLKAEYPDLSLEEIIKIVKRKYIERDTEKKKNKYFKKNRGISINIKK